MRVTSRHLLPHLGLFRHDKLFLIHWHCIPLWQLRIYLLWLDFMDVCFFCYMLFFLKSRSLCKKWLLIFVAIIKYYFGCYMLYIYCCLGFLKNVPSILVDCLLQIFYLTIRNFVMGYPLHLNQMHYVSWKEFLLNH